MEFIVFKQHGYKLIILFLFPQIKSLCLHHSHITYNSLHQCVFSISNVNSFPLIHPDGLFPPKSPCPASGIVILLSVFFLPSFSPSLTPCPLCFSLFYSFFFDTVLCTTVKKGSHCMEVVRLTYFIKSCLPKVIHKLKFDFYFGHKRASKFHSKCLNT